MRKKMSPAKSRLLASTFTMVIALLLVVGSTLAWFTISTNPEISGIQFSLGTWENLLIARDDPDIDPMDLDYKTTIDMNDIFSFYTELTPVSTADLRNWFIPAYNAGTGALRPVEDFIWDPNLEYANSFKVKTENGEVLFSFDGETSSAIPLSGVELLNAQRKGYYVYADFWLKTEEKEGTNVYLSFPHYGVPKAAAKNELEGYFGTYVLPVLQTRVGLNGEIFLSPKEFNSECAMRLGLAVYENGRASDSWSNWFIYEPNADKRSVMPDKPALEDEYIIGYTKSSAEYSDGIYIETNPIGFPAGETEYLPVPESAVNPGNIGSMKVEYTQVTDIGAIRSTATDVTYFIPSSAASIYEPVTGAEAYALMKDNPGQRVYTREVFRKKFEAISLEPKKDHLIVQMAGAWNTEAPETLATLASGGRLSSKNLSYFGNFVSSYSLFSRLEYLRRTVPDCRSTVCKSQSKLYPWDYTDPEGIDSLRGDSTSQLLLQLNYNEPVKLRLFAWVEGQDIDCWNDIAAGTVQVNLEFAGMTRDD